MIDRSIKFFLIVAGIFLLGAGAVVINQKTSSKPTPPNKIDIASKPLGGSQTVVYGVWQSKSSVIKAVNTDGTEDSVLATLPLNIKDVNIFSDSQVLYIADTDSSDHGKRIVFYDLSTKEEKMLYQAESEWGIDDIVLSSDRTHLAWWEVQLGEGGKLSGGYSRVSTAGISGGVLTGIKPVFSEKINAIVPVHYPLFFDHNNNLYSDGFIPNGGGWNLELVRTNTQGEHALVLVKGSYNSDPILHPAQNKIVYTGYESDRGTPFTPPGGQAVRMARVGFFNPNTLYSLDLDTNVRTTVPVEANRHYYSPSFSYDGNVIYVRSYAHDGKKLKDPMLLVIASDTGNGESISADQLPGGVFLASSPDGILFGETVDSGDVANLGSKYAPQLQFVSLYRGGEYPATYLVSNNVQYIGLIDRFSGQKLGIGPALEKQDIASMQLSSFDFKSDLGGKRASQQNDSLQFVDASIPINPSGNNSLTIVIAGGSATPGLSPTTVVTPTGVGTSSGTSISVGSTNELTITIGGAPGLSPTAVVTPTGVGGGSMKCKDLFDQLIGSGELDASTDFVTFRREQKTIVGGVEKLYKCYDSPLYLYPDKPTDVAIQVKNAVLLSSSVPYTNDGWHVTAHPNGAIYQNGTFIGTRIDYTYKAAFTAPSYGLVVDAKEMETALFWYAHELGLAAREKEDFVSFWRKNLPKASYFFVSHFDQPSSIMDFFISPRPDSFIQAIMYFKPLPEQEVRFYRSYPAPSFTEVPKRTGFTAVDWSGIIDQ